MEPYINMYCQLVGGIGRQLIRRVSVYDRKSGADFTAACLPGGQQLWGPPALWRVADWAPIAVWQLVERLFSIINVTACI